MLVTGTLVQQAGSAIAAKWRLREATRADLPRVADVYLAAFPQSVAYYLGVDPGAQETSSVAALRGFRELMADVFSICLAAEPDAFIVAESDVCLGGYIFAPSDVPRVRRRALSLAHTLPMLARLALNGHPRLWRAITLSLRNALSTHRQEQRQRRNVAASPARILSIAVHPRCVGQGLGLQLATAGLEYLRGRGAAEVRLEVRPGNEAALRLYRRLGFVEAGKTCDSQGPWLVMLANLAGQQVAVTR